MKCFYLLFMYTSIMLIMKCRWVFLKVCKLSGVALKTIFCNILGYLRCMNEHIHGSTPVRLLTNFSS